MYNIKYDAHGDAKVESTIFKEGTKFDDGKGPSAKDLTDTLRVRFKIILGCIHHRPIPTLLIISTPLRSLCYSFWRKTSRWDFQQFCLGFSGIR